mmetsp:Transcript_30673/g.34231  ORF Transcript_30673/g.34231 Transcript_30673/m.34231 type:complete len:117 (-) Transcript_30673:112-462(-)
MEMIGTNTDIGIMIGLGIEKTKDGGPAGGTGMIEIVMTETNDAINDHIVRREIGMIITAMMSLGQKGHVLRKKKKNVRKENLKWERSGSKESPVPTYYSPESAFFIFTFTKTHTFT